MIGIPANARVWIASGVTYLRHAFTRLGALVQAKLEKVPFRVMFVAKRLERGHFVWPQATSGTVALTRAKRRCANCRKQYSGGVGRYNCRPARRHCLRRA